ncbi:uroporphyrinogen-III synthase [Asanoa ishikariensis]|uniref:Uroporphyrinogen-III synthase n=1 Tax=Asanoa ishikariensis TaxID=137265 RepID=A0A1H3MHY5_9ACTN|nr:uroporphyrinogen-III synthase [Asanoa ishikariensis]GIF66138.1 uroporphyrinogen-III synthase [Asanoa ishikariensis]SDY76143.1 uroporphyrinogen-III synthase [Asanoa ishikariensis]
MTPLLGFTVAITAERRRDELGALLERRGARVVSAPAITIIPLLDDAALRTATVACVEHAPDIVVATTGIGFRGWLEAAEGWGVGEALRGGLGTARLIARGAKPCGAIRAAGLTEQWSAPTESCAEILDKLLAEGVAGRRIAVQLHGGPQDEFTTALRAAGADVVEVPVYRWTAREDQEPLRRLVDQIVAGQVDAVTFTSAPAVIALLDAAGDRAPAVLDAFGDRVLAACVGPVTAAPLRERGVPTLVPDRARLGALVRAVTDALPARARRLVVAGREVELRGHAAIVDGEYLPLAPASMAVLRALAAQPGTVVSRARLASALPSGTQGAIDMAVARLRSSLGAANLVETVIKRGYRLRVPA